MVPYKCLPRKESLLWEQGRLQTEMLHHQDWNFLGRKLAFLLSLGWLLHGVTAPLGSKMAALVKLPQVRDATWRQLRPRIAKPENVKAPFRAGNQEMAFWKVSSIYCWQFAISNLFPVRTEMKNQMQTEKHQLRWKFILERCYIGIYLPLSGRECGR